MLIAFLLFVAFISFFQTWQTDQSILSEISNTEITAKNWLGKLGASISNYILYQGFGIGSFVLPILLFFSGLFLLLRKSLKGLRKPWFFGLIGMIWTSLLFGLIKLENPLFAGTVGYELEKFLASYIGKIGIIAVLFISLLGYFIVRFGLTPTSFSKLFPKRKNKTNAIDKDTTSEIITKIENDKSEETELEVYSHKEDIISDSKTATDVPELEISTPEEAEILEIDIKKVVEEASESENLSNKLLTDFGEFDPKLELSNFKFPTLDMLKDYNESIAVNSEELQQNKDKIVDTLKNYKIGISHIKATVGPTVTLYEIIPQAGIRISKIKNLEDDIALSLSALGIRIIAPIPGKGTIGIEVPNKNPSIVSMRSVIASAKFQNSEMDLPVAFGKTISNETFVVDLAKMPHLLMAGATGQGKSVGLNAVIASLLYKKHPAEVKFVLVDPKKIELSLYTKIERHYLAKLPDTEEAIITDVTKVVNTLNSLCIEMDDRYDLLKVAQVRNIKEYNTKFKNRLLNPENGHRFLPYIVLVLMNLPI